jgi:hypothetical protein
MAQVVSRRPLTSESRVRAQVNHYGISDGQSGNETGYSPSSSVFPLSVSFHRRSSYSYIIRGMNNMSVSGRSSET